jgi:hypothetical protein
MAVDQKIGKGGAVGGVEQLRTGSRLDEHGGRRYAGRPVVNDRLKLRENQRFEIAMTV